MIDQPHLEAVQAQFAHRAEEYDHSARWITDPALLAAHVALAGPPSGRALDLCCGTGQVGRSLQAAGWEVVGLDLTPEMLAHAARHFETIPGDAHALPFPEASFSLVVVRQALFLLDPPTVLDQIHRVLAPGGHFVLGHTVPFGEEDEVWLRAIHLRKQAQFRHFLGRADLLRLLGEHGFRVTGEKTLSVRESLTAWMARATELSNATREEVLELVRRAPRTYRQRRRVEEVQGELCEDWCWVVLRGLREELE